MVDFIYLVHACHAKLTQREGEGELYMLMQLNLLYINFLSSQDRSVRSFLTIIVSLYLRGVRFSGNSAERDIDLVGTLRRMGATLTFLNNYLHPLKIVYTKQL